MDLRQVLIEGVDRLIASGEVEKKIEATLAKVMNEVIDHELRSYSDFGKQLTEMVKKSFALNGEIDLPSYNHTILAIIRKQVEHSTTTTIQTQVAERMKELLQTPPESITLTDLVAKYIEHVKEHKLAGCVCYGEASHSITCELEESDYGFRYVHLDDEANQPKNRCEIVVGISKEGEVFNLRFNNADVEKQMFVGSMYGFERMLFQMKAAKSKLIIDAEPYFLNLSYADHVD